MFCSIHWFLLLKRELGCGDMERGEKLGALMTLPGWSSSSIGKSDTGRSTSCTDCATSDG